MGKYHHKMGIVVSITLSEIYESQWLQVNFNRVCKYIRSDAILIPRQSGLSVVPVLSANYAANAYSFLQRCQQYRYRNETHGYERQKSDLKSFAQFTRAICTNVQRAKSSFRSNINSVMCKSYPIIAIKCSHSPSIGTALWPDFAGILMLHFTKISNYRIKHGYVTTMLIAFQWFISRCGHHKW